MGSLGCEQAEEALRDLEKFSQETCLPDDNETPDQDSNDRTKCLQDIFKRKLGGSESHCLRLLRFQHNTVSVNVHTAHACRNTHRIIFVVRHRRVPTKPDALPQTDAVERGHCEQAVQQ